MFFISDILSHVHRKISVKDVRGCFGLVFIVLIFATNVGKRAKSFQINNNEVKYSIANFEENCL